MPSFALIDDDGFLRAAGGLAVREDCPPEGCGCDGGGGGDCCVCGRCFFDQDAPGWTAGQATVSAVVTVTGGGVDIECCRGAGPSGVCFESEIVVARETIVFGVDLALVHCDTSGSDYFFYDTTTYNCEWDALPYPVTESLRLRSLSRAGDSCPEFRLPNTGAVIETTTTYRVITIWGGARCAGPLVMARTTRELLKLPGGFARVTVFAVVGAGGGSSFIAIISPLCPGLCVGGCNIDLEITGPYRIDGGGTIAGAFDCDGPFTASVQMNATFTGGCEYDFNEDCESFNGCVSTGQVAISIDCGIETHFGGLLGQCPPNPERGGGGLGGDDPDDADQIVVPQAWLDEFPELAAAVAAIRAATPGGDQVPPPSPVGPDRRGPGDFF